MCYAIPGRVVSVAAQTAVVDYFGERRKVRHECLPVRAGDYVYAQGGYVIERVPAAAAVEILNVWKEAFFTLQEVDLGLSRMDLEKAGATRGTVQLLDRALEGRLREPHDLLQLLRLGQGPERALLFKTANFLRHRHLGNSCCVHGVIEFSNLCRESCNYCGISRHNARLRRRRMRPEDVIAAAVEASERYGCKALVLQSGEDPGYPVDRLCSLVRAIKSRTGVLLFVSFGEVGLDGLRQLYDAGARGLLMRFETGNPELYARCHPGNSLRSRLAHLQAARRLGYVIITGGLIGLPGQTDQDLVRDILLAKTLGADMYSFGPFLPHPHTPLAGAFVPPVEKILAVLALIRLLDPANARILVTTGLETLDARARESALMAGANSVMLNLTPENFRKYYTLYPGRAHRAESIPRQISDALDLLRRLGRAPTDLGGY